MLESGAAEPRGKGRPPFADTLHVRISVEGPGVAMQQARVSNVLVVEDEPRIRQLVAKVLRRRGFVVLEAEDAEAAMRLFGGQAADISLLLTDVVMPGMNGHALAEALATSQPDLKVIYMSGFDEDELTARGIGGVGAAFITKPFTPDVLSMIVEGILGR